MKKSILLLLTAFMFLLTACSTQKAESDASSDTAAPSSGTSISTDAVTDDKIDANEDTSFVLGTDDQPFYISKTGMCVSNGSGEYCFYRDTLYFYDNNVQTAVVVCSKPDCEHKTNVDEGENNCNAFFPSDRFYFDNGYAYFDDCLYVLGRGSDSKTTVSLYKISADGAIREEVCKLFETTDINSIGVFTLHRGFAFWTLNTENGAQLFRMKISDKNSVEQVFSSDKPASYILRFMGAGDYLYFPNYYSEDENYENWKYAVYRLNLKSGVIESVISTNGTYTVIDNKIFYLDSGKLCCSSLDGKSVTEIIDIPENSTQIVSDTKYLYLTNWDNGITDSADYKVFVFTTDGELVDAIPIPDCTFFYGGYSDNLYIESGSELKVFDKSQIGTGSYEWDRVYTVSANGQVILN